MFKGGLGDLMRQAQEFGQNLKAKQEEMGRRTVDVSVGGDMVRMTFNGRSELLSVTIDPEVVDKNDVAMLQDLVQAAVNEGVRESQRLMKEELSKITGGLNIPGITS